MAQVAPGRGKGTVSEPPVQVTGGMTVGVNSSVCSPRASAGAAESTSVPPCTADTTVPLPRAPLLVTSLTSSPAITLAVPPVQVTEVEVGASVHPSTEVGAKVKEKVTVPVAGP